MSQIDKWNLKRKHPRHRKAVKDKTTVNNVPLVHVPSLPNSMVVEDMKVVGNLDLGVLHDVSPTTPYLLGTDPDGGGGIIPVLQSSSSLTDNVAPGASPTPTVTGGQRWLSIKWPTQVNADIVTYEVHVGTSNVFVASASTLVAETKTNLIFIRNRDSAGNPLQYGVDYYVRIIAKDDDGAAAPSGAIGPTRLDPNAVDDYTAGSITADKFAAVLALVSALSAGVPLAERIDVGFGTKDDGLGNTVIDGDFIGIRAYEADGTTNTFKVDALTGQVYIKGSLDFGDSRILKENVIELGQQVATGVQVPAIVQSSYGASQFSASSAQASWAAPTTEGNLCIAVVYTWDADGTNPGITGFPSGMQLVTDRNDAATDTYIALYATTVTSAIRSGAEIFTFSDQVHWSVHIYEVSGVKVQAVANVTNTTGAGTSPVDPGSIVSGADDDFHFVTTGFLTTETAGVTKGDFTNSFEEGELTINFHTDIGGVPTSDGLWYHRDAYRIGNGGANSDTEYTVSPAPLQWVAINTTWTAKPAGIETPSSGKVRLYNTVDRFAIPSLTTKDDSGAVRSVRDFQDIQGRLQYNNDFVGGVTVGAGASKDIDGMLSALTVGAGTSIADATVSDGHPGVWQLDTGSTAAGVANIGAFRSATNNSFPGGTGDVSRMTFVVRIPGTLSGAVNRYRVAMGFMDGNDPNSVTQKGIWVVYCDVSPAIAGGGSVSNNSFTLFHGDGTDLAADPLDDGTGVATPVGNDWFRIDIEHKLGVGTSVWINGDKKCTNFTTNLPAVSSNLSMKCGIWKYVGTASRPMQVDLLAFEYIMGTPR